jgi:23S rRNA (uracil1939-C5)-methyltransferase
MGKKISKIYPGVHITGIADRGKAVGRHEGQVIFVEGAVPGDVADVLVQSRKAGQLLGRVEKLIVPSPDRREPVCAHFGTCGGCKWQHFAYEAQLRHKQQAVEDAFRRIGKVAVEEYLPIIGAPSPLYYRNKLEFTASDRRWLSLDEIRSEEVFQRDGLGFHLPGHFDKVVDIETCHLQPEPSNAIRNAIREYARAHGLTFYNVRSHQGGLRNVIVRTASTGQVMVTVSFGAQSSAEQREGLLSYLQRRFPEITSLQYAVNGKQNDVLYDLDISVFAGQPYIVEQLGDVRFHVGPKSFFQTNTAQALALYETAREFAGLTGQETVYDLYTGLGSIACFVAGHSARVIGIEEVEPAVEDARVNARINGFDHLHFYAGDVKALLTDQLVAQHGAPDVVITDPPRAGMHPKVVETLLALNPPRIVYVSCNPATQARDLALMAGQYAVLKSRAVDMFPHTHHIENVVLLERKP